MEKIKRPATVDRTKKGYLSNERYQDLVNAQLKLIYEKLDEIVDEIG